MARAILIGRRSMLGRAIAARLDECGITVLGAGRHADDDIALDLATGTLPDRVPSADIVFHVAASFAPDTPDGLAINIRTNAEGAIHAARLAVACRAGILVHAGTLAAAPGFDPAPLSGYSLSKVMAENLLHRALAGTSTALAILRLPQLHDSDGECCRHQPWFGRVIAYQSRGETLRLPRSEGPRNFLHVTDAARLIVAAGTGQTPGAFDIVHPEMITMEAFAALAAEIFGQPDRSLIVPSKPPFRRLHYPDGGPAFARLGVTPEISLARSIAMIRDRGTEDRYGPRDVA